MGQKNESRDPLEASNVSFPANLHEPFHKKRFNSGLKGEGTSL